MKNKVLSGFSWNFGNRIIANTVQLLVYFFLAKILDPKDFGAVAIVMIVINFGKILSTSGLGASIIQEKVFSKKKYIVLQTLSICLGFTAMISLMFFAPIIGNYYSDFEKLEELLILASPILLFSSIYAVQSSMLIRDLNFKGLFFISVIPAIIAGIISITLANRGYGASSIIWNSLISLVICVLFLSLKFKKFNRFNFKFRSIKKSIKFSGNILFINLLEEAYKSLYTLFIGKKFGDKDLGFYNFGRQLPGYASLTVNATLSTILFPTLSKQSFKEKTITYNKAFIYSILFYAPLIGLTFLLAEDIIILLFNDKWNESLPYIYMFSLIYGLHNLHYNYTQFLYSSGKSKEALKFESIKKLIAIIFFLITINQSLFLITLGQLLASVVFVIYTLILTYLKHRFPSKKYLLKTVTILTFNLIVFFTLQITSDTFQNIVLKILFCTVIYLLFLIWLLKYLKILDFAKILKK